MVILKRRESLFFKFLLIMVIGPLVYAGAAQNIAKVSILRGQVMVKDAETQTTRELKLNDWVTEGSMIQSGPKSFVKLTFNDQSQMNLGPESKIIVSKFPKDRPGVISVIQGELRGKVTKDVLKGNQDEKLMITTKTAAMGIRGTDFQVAYNAENKTTSLVTFEGAVAMAKVEPQSTNIFNAGSIGQRLKSEGTVTVQQGQFSGASPNTTQSTIPTKISPAQFESLKKNDQLKEKEVEQKKQFSSPIPPGIAAQSMMSTANVVDKGAAGSAASVASKDQIKSPPAEGMVDKKTGSFAPPAGGFVDLKTGLYIAPPPGSTFDANTGVYVPPPGMGGFDPATGHYTAPAGMVLTASGDFKSADGNALPAGKGPMLSVALMAGNFLPPNQALMLSDSGKINAVGDLASQGAGVQGPVKASADMLSKMQDLIDNAKTNRDNSVQQIQQQVLQNNINTINATGNSTVNFSIDVQ